MDHRIPKTSVAVSIALAVAALVTFLFLNNRFEGPDPTDVFSSSFELQAEFDSTKKLPTKQPVLYKGISIGRVNKVDWDPEAQVSVVTFTLDDDFEVHDDAVLQIGERSLLGDPYLNLLARGSEEAPKLAAGDEVERTRASVDFDEALDFLDEDGRESAANLIETVGRGLSPGGNGANLNGTVAGVSRTVRELHELTDAIRGQENELTRLVSDGSAVLTEIGEREKSVRTIVASGRDTLDALASNTASIEQAIAELPRVLEAGRTSLAEAEPLIAEARPLVADLRELSPDLRFAFSDETPYPLGDLVTETTQVVEALSPLREAAVPVLRDLDVLLDGLEPLVKSVAPAARNLVPALRYLTPRVKSIAGLYALVAAVTANEDAISNYIRVGFVFEPGEGSDMPTPAKCEPETQNVPPNQGYCFNAYPGPDDALDPQPYEPPYPRLLPCDVPPRSTPKKPCD
ncbi:MAG: MlaD family protein [Solirubrobacterales bacterium]